MNKNNNVEIRGAIEKNRIYSYEVAAELNISAVTLARWMRTELPDSKKEAVLEAINKLINDRRY